LSNLPWIVEEKNLEKMLEVPRVTLLNDLEATAHSLPVLRPKDLLCLNRGKEVQGGNMAVIAPGTGLGEAFLTADGTGYRVHASEGGHTDFAPKNELELQVLTILIKRFGHVSYEKLCSGRGLPNIYDSLREIGHEKEDPAIAEAIEKAEEAIMEARDQGLTRFIGVTGHGMTAPTMLIKSLERFEFDSVLLPYNYLIVQDKEYADAFDRLVDLCRQSQTAIQTIKSMARRPWPKERLGLSWYEPLRAQDDIGRAANWVLGNPDVFLITSSEMSVLPDTLKSAAAGGVKPGDEEMSQMVARQEMRMIFEGTKTLMV
jgi:hypothetical protein